MGSAQRIDVWGDSISIWFVCAQMIVPPDTDLIFAEYLINDGFHGRAQALRSRLVECLP